MPPRLPGHKVLLHLAPGSKEDTASCRKFFQDMRRRGWVQADFDYCLGAMNYLEIIESDLSRLGDFLAHLKQLISSPRWPRLDRESAIRYLYICSIGSPRIWQRWQ